MDSLQNALALFRDGRLAEAEAACERLRTSPRERHGALTLLAELRMDSGRAEAAFASLEEIARLTPRDAANLRRLGGALITVGRAAAAADVLTRAVREEPANVRGHNNLGQALLKSRQLPEAAACFTRALELDPRYTIARFNLGLALEGLERPLEALREYDALLDLQRTHQAGWARRGALQWRMGRPADALASLNAALALRPDDAGSLALRAAALLALGRGAEALAAADQALAFEATSVEALQYRAAALSQLHRAEEALRCLEHAAELAPENVEVWCNRAVIHHRLGDAQSARRCFSEALRLDPASLTARSRLLASSLAPVPATAEESQQDRGAFEDALTAFERWLENRLENRPLQETEGWAIAQQPFFYLSYQDCSNRSLLQRYRTRAAAALAPFTPEPTVRAPAATAERRRFRLGIVSAHVFEHSVFRALTRGWLERLDRDAFEITVFHLGNRHDDATALAQRCADRFDAGPKSLPEWVRVIRDGGLDALVYPEIGIDPGTLALASLRLAPRQFAAWGHPETSGLPTMDAFLSAEAFEVQGAEAHYSERLIRLPHLGVYVEPTPVEPARLDLDALGIRHQRPWFVCAGTPYKYHPAHDAVWVQIARRVPDSTLVFFEYERPALSALLRRRLEGGFAAAGLDASRQLRWIPWQPRPVFRELLRHATGYLDTLGFSGFNTLLAAVEAGLPCVAFDGRFLRGRLGSGILRHLALDELVAGDTAGYVDIAVRLATDPVYRAEVSARLQSAAPRAFADAGAIRALERCLVE
jgi:predicted O-linked N-acetylglucosamine transferase (SPINDLY family)